MCTSLRMSSCGSMCAHSTALSDRHWRLKSGTRHATLLLSKVAGASASDRPASASSWLAHWNWALHCSNFPDTFERSSRLVRSRVTGSAWYFQGVVTTKHWHHQLLARTRRPTGGADH